MADPMFEREAETARIERALEHGRAGEGELLVLQGAPGIGKSRLLDEAARLARTDARVLRARAGELERSFAFGVVRQLFDPLAGEDVFEGAAALAAPLFDPARLTEAPGDALYPLLHGLFWLCANAAGERPVVLCVDDAHWADEPSLAFLGFLARRIGDLPITVLVSTRPVEPAANPTLSALVAAAGDVVRPAGLSAAAVAALLDADPDVAAACAAKTDGNPFLIGELARLLAAEGGPPTVARVDALGPRAAADSLALRIARLPGARELLEALAVLGDAMTSEDDALVSELRLAGVLAPGPGLAFAHPVLRTAVYEGIAPAARERAHIEAARAALADARPPEQVAVHLLQVPRPLGAWTLPPLQAAAGAARAVGDVGTAQRVLRRLLLEELDAATELATLAMLGQAQLLAMDPAGASTLETVLAETDDPDLAVGVATGLGALLLFSGEIPAFVATLSRTEEQLRPARPELADRLAGGLLAATQMSGRAARELAPRIDALQDGGAPPATLAERSQLIAIAYRDVLSDQPIDGVRERLRRALAPALADDPREPLLAAMMASAPLVMAELYDETLALTAAELERARPVGNVISVAVTLCLRSWCHLRRGDLLAAETDAREALALIADVGFRGFSTTMAQAALLTCARETGAPLGDLASVLDAPPPDPDVTPHGILLLARAQALAARGETEAALASLLDAPYGDTGPSLLPWRSVAAGFLDDLGRRGEAVALADEELRRARASGARGALGIALRARAALDDLADAETRLEEAVGVLAESGARLDHARALIDLGSLQRRTGRRADSRAPLQEGLELATRCGATVLAGHAREELAATGVRLAPPGLSGAQALTPSERRVAAMAAEGLRNREIAQRLFVTEKTVETHLSRSYDKLGVRSRSALTDALAA